MPVNRKATPGRSRTPRTAWPSSRARSAAASRGPARKHAGGAPSLNSTLRVAHASGTVCNRVAGVVSTNHKQPTYGRSKGTGRRSVSRAPLSIALATSTDAIVSRRRLAAAHTLARFRGRQSEVDKPTDPHGPWPIPHCVRSPTIGSAFAARLAGRLLAAIAARINCLHAKPTVAVRLPSNVTPW